VEIIANRAGVVKAVSGACAGIRSASAAAIDQTGHQALQGVWNRIHEHPGNPLAHLAQAVADATCLSRCSRPRTSQGRDRSLRLAVDSTAQCELAHRLCGASAQGGLPRGCAMNLVLSDA
jgi:hypothetical protein